MPTAVYTTGPVENGLTFNDAEFVRARILNRNATGGASVTVKVFNVGGTRTLITGGQQNGTVPANSGNIFGPFDTSSTGAFEVVIQVTHPTNVNKVLVSVWGFDNDAPGAAIQLLAQYRFAHKEMHRLS